MGRIEDLFNKRKETTDSQSEGYENAKAKSRAEARDTYSSDIPSKREALLSVQEDLSPLFDELRNNPRTMFLLPNLNPLKIGMAKVPLTTAHHEKVDINEPVLFCKFGKCDSDRLKDKGSHSTKYGQDGDQRVLISYDTENSKYDIQEQSYSTVRSRSANDNYESTKRKWSNGGDTKGLSREEVLKYMEERLVDVLAHHKRATPGRLTKLAIAAAVAFGISQCTGNSDVAAMENTDNINAKNSQIEQFDVPVTDSSSLEL